MSMGKILKEKMSKGTVIAPFVIDGMQACYAEKVGFEAVYMTGFGTASTIGIPDIGLLTLTEMTENIRKITSCIDIPVIADADTGYGNHINVMRTVREYEKAGAAALHIEDQVWPKRCGYLANKQVIPKEEAVLKIKTAVDSRKDPDFIIIARTDALAVGGWDEVEDRIRSFAEAGADMFFVDGIRENDIPEYKRRLGDLPILFNDVPLIPLEKVKDVGFKIIIHPGALTIAIKAYEDGLINLKNDSFVPLDDPFYVLHRTVEVLGAEKYFKLDELINKNN